ncbi:MAG: hypothetical protein R3B81_06565 [bacterium]
MLHRLQVVPDSADARSRSFQARGAVDLPADEAAKLARDLEAGAITRFYRGGPPLGRVLSARATADGLWIKIGLRARDQETWRLVESGAITTVDVQPLPQGVDLFLKSSAATCPTGESVIW